MDGSVIQNVWLADLLTIRRDLITKYWIEEIRAEHITGYDSVTDEQLDNELPPTVDSMIYAFRTGDTQGPRRHSADVIRRRLVQGLKLPDLQMSLHALETAVMRVVREVNVDQTKELEATRVAGTMYYLVALIAAEVYEQLRAEQQSRFTKAYEFGITLSRELELDALLDTAVARVAEYTDGDSVAILLVEPQDGHERLRAYHELDPELADTLSDMSQTLGCGAEEAGNPDVREIACTIDDVRSDPRLVPHSELLEAHGRLSVLCAPLIAKKKRLGSLMILWREAHAISAAEMDFIFAVAGHIANAVQNAILYEEAKGKRELGLLLHSSRLFTSSLDTDDVLRKIARMATEAVSADLAIVFTQDSTPEHSHTAYYARGRKAKCALPRVLDAVVSEGKDNKFSSLGRDFARGKARLYRTCQEFPGRMSVLSGMGASGMVVPLKQKNNLLGAFALISLVPGAFTEDDLSLATGLADLASIAIGNARSYEYERNIAETLQRSFLPASLPHIVGYDTAAYYRPAMAEAAIGGDFYDVFTTGDGNVALIIGDVSGKGLKAAVPTVMGKYVVRAYAAEGLQPADVMGCFNRAFFENVSEGLFMTAFYCTLNPATNVVTYASAGHDPPILYSSRNGTIKLIDETGICLGIGIHADYTGREFTLEPGDVLLLYTDGATDVKGDEGRLGIDGLKRLLLQSAHGSAEDIVREVSDGIWDYSHGRLPDDVALVVLKRLEESPTPGDQDAE